MRFVRRCWVFVVAIAMLGAAPAHVPTSDYWSGYAGTHKVPADVASRWLTWTETGIGPSQEIRPYGVKTMLYTDPNRQIPGEPMYTQDESTFAHDCGGNRITSHRPNQYLMDPRSKQMGAIWKNHVLRYSAEGHFDAIFNDDAANLEYITSQPCNASREEWLRATIQQIRDLQYPVVYNALSVFDGHNVSKMIALNQAAIGGMEEECYASSPQTPKVGDWKWVATENTEIRMAREGKYFFCYGNDTSPADSSIDGRMYVYGSYLLTYNPHTSVLWEYYKTDSGLHIMPEVQFVPLDPVKKNVDGIDDLRNRDGVYVREYKNCYLKQAKVGKCAIVVNPDNSEHRISLHGFNHTLALSGPGVLDGGTAQVSNNRPPDSIAPLSAIIAIR